MQWRCGGALWGLGGGFLSEEVWADQPSCSVDLKAWPGVQGWTGGREFARADWWHDCGPILGADARVDAAGGEPASKRVSRRLSVGGDMVMRYRSWSVPEPVWGGASARSRARRSR